jgi:hypothetical protein
VRKKATPKPLEQRPCDGCGKPYYVTRVDRKNCQNSCAVKSWRLWKRELKTQKLRET